MTDFRSIYQHGFARVAACTGHAAIADPPANAESVLRQARRCDTDGVAVAVFPELGLSGYSIEDLLLQDALLDEVFALGTPDAVRTKVTTFHEAGADHVALNVVTRDDTEIPLPQWHTLAEALL
ncbi:hypothetical protein K6C39_21900 [Vibrio vulnificus]|nr:hypothetical protein [Vibrio vulnificus]